MNQMRLGFDGIPEAKKDKTVEEEIEASWGASISVYTREQAIEDGVMVRVGEVAGVEGKIGICFTWNLLAGGGYDIDPERRKWLVNYGIRKLKEEDPEDSETMRLRVLEDPGDLEHGEIWCIHDGDGILFLRPEDY
ncbi:MAG: hypothetical protein JRH07_18055 [Deltaproteobacteria bacterium]|nr:hypothetical protein [Deltaproteobacteria bacterium]